MTEDDAYLSKLMRQREKDLVNIELTRKQWVTEREWLAVHLHLKVRGEAWEPVDEEPPTEDIKSEYRRLAEIALFALGFTWD